MNATQRKSDIAKCLKRAQRNANVRGETLYVVEVDHEEGTMLLIVGARYVDSNEFHAFEGIIHHTVAPTK